jgi:hypothetical protein
MSERLVEIPIERTIREQIKEIKGVKTYSEFFAELLEDKK